MRDDVFQCNDDMVGLKTMNMSVSRRQKKEGGAIVVTLTFRENFFTARFSAQKPGCWHHGRHGDFQCFQFRWGRCHLRYHC